MKIIERTGKTLRAGLEGRLDLNTSEPVYQELLAALEDAAELVIDCTELSYLSSAGIRVLLSLQKEMIRRGGAMSVAMVNDDIYDILEISGFTDIVSVDK